MGQPSQPVLDPLIGTTLGRYAIQAKLGEGGMGTVYRAEQWPLGRPVALKVIHRSLAQESKVASRFLREAKISCALTNPHTVTIYDFGQADDGTLYLAMELLVGESLQQRLTEKGRIDPGTAAEIAAQVCRSLVEAHRKGIVHRDLKPDNIFLTTSDEGTLLAKVLDYGLARITTAEEHAPGSLLTQIGTIVGTPIYMSPEQARGKALDARTDLYSMGVVLFEMLTGVPPFQDEDAVLVLGKHIREPVPLMESVGARVAPPEALEILVHALLQKKPEDRPPDAIRVYQALRDYLMLSGTRGASLPSMPAEEGSQPRTVARVGRPASPQAESGILERPEPEAGRLAPEAGRLAPEAAPEAPEPHRDEVEELDVSAAESVADSSPTAADAIKSEVQLESAPTSIIPMPTPAQHVLPSEGSTVTDDEPTNAATPLPSKQSWTPQPVQAASLSRRSAIYAPRNLLLIIGAALVVLVVALVVVTRDELPDSTSAENEGAAALRVPLPSAPIGAGREQLPAPPVQVSEHPPSTPLPAGAAPAAPSHEAPPGFDLRRPPRGWSGSYSLAGGSTLELDERGTTVSGSFGGQNARRASLRGTVAGPLLTFAWVGRDKRGRGVLRSYVSGDRVKLIGALGLGSATEGELELTADRTAEATPAIQPPRIIRKNRPWPAPGSPPGLTLDTDDIFRQRQERR